MLPRERVIAALNHQTPDRVPVGEFGVDYPITERALGRPTFYRAKWKEYKALWEGRRDEVVESYKRDLVDLARAFQWDFVPVMLAPSAKREYRPPRFLSKYVWEDESGAIWQFSPESEGWAICIRHPEVTMDDLVDEEPVIDESQLEIVRHVVKELGSTHYIIGRGGDGSFPETGGLDSFLMRMITEPAFVHRATEIATRHALAVNQALLDAGVDCIWAGADYCDSRGPMMSPRHFREYIQPAIRALCDHAHSRGTYLIKHTDGSTWPILDMMLEAGIDGWHGIQPQIGMDMKLLKERYGDRLVLVGGVDCHTLCAGTEEDVRRETAYALRHAGHDGGLILCSGNTLMVGVKYENYIAMLDEAGIELDPEVRKGLGKRI